MSDSDGTKSTSTQQVVTALVSNSVIFGAFISMFLLLRIKLKRIYEPKSSYQLINEEKRPEPLPSGLWQWVVPLLKKSDNFVIQQAGLDGYFFLRYLLIIALFCSASIVYVFPVLFAVNASNGAHESGLNQLAYQNVKDPKRYYAHVFVSWVFYWSFLYVVYRELFFYTSMRQAVLASPRYAKKLSSRTVLFQTVPKQYLSETEFSKLFDGVKRVWIARGADNIEDLVSERESMAMQLEQAAIAYQRSAVTKIHKMRKKNPSTIVEGDISTYIPAKKRPRQAKNFWNKLIFRKSVDTIDYLKEELPKINDEIKDLQDDHINGEPFNSVFVEFESQYQAQVASQVTTFHAPLFMTPAYIGLEPENVVWFNLRMFWWERLSREVGSISAICALVILWAFPVAFVGMISNITYLTDKVHWLRFIYKLPDQLLGLLTSLAPTVALAVLMSFLPRIIRGMAVLQGSPSSQKVEHFTQNAYFAFQVVQVFLVTTITSAATSVVTQIVKEPTKAMELLAENLPKASNFYISYIILQGMSISSGALLQIAPLAIYYLLGKLLDNTPRKQYKRFTSLASMDWGTTYPVYTNLAVIVFSYSIISPIILLFCACGYFLLYIAYLYNLTYVFSEAPDSRGINYPRALFQTMTGMYIGEICLLGLFVVGKGWGPIVLQVICMCVTVIMHLQLNHAFDHLMTVLPVDTMKPLDGKTDTPSFKNIYGNREDSQKSGIKELPQFPIPKYQPKNPFSNPSDTKSGLSDTTYPYMYDEALETPENNVIGVPLLADGDTVRIPPAPFWKRFFKPHIYNSYKAVKSRLPEIYGLVDPDEIQDENKILHAYDFPAVSAQCPYLWIPEDEYGFSKQIIKELESVVDISDRNATMDTTGKISFTGRPPTDDETEGSSIFLKRIDEDDEQMSV
ncbi:Rsn1 protein [Maudiozyma humilis]|uniref:Rsn1 protein n=1 Tax=Maudiozyma humilis TaxID=51915 RepID=A0AAV5S0R2_MAUHU|nr:Rsn1 protein [Kazachstania humilis]